MNKTGSIEKTLTAIQTCSISLTAAEFDQSPCEHRYQLSFHPLAVDRPHILSSAISLQRFSEEIWINAKVPLGLIMISDFKRY